jgi:hypothetical protein
VCGSVRHHDDLARFGALGLSRKKSIRAAEANPEEQARFEKTQ